VSFLTSRRTYYGYGDSEKENVVTLVRVESRKPQAATIDIF